MLNKKLTLTIVIPVFNEQNYLRSCLDAIARQSVKPDQVIVVDNNSSDQTCEIAGSYPFVTLLHETKQGVVFARDRGFNAATGHLIARIDADTILPANWVKTAKELYLEAGSPQHYAVTAPSHFRNHLSFICYCLHRLTYFWPSRLIIGHTTFVGSNMFITKSLWQSVRSRTCRQTNMHEDMDLAYHVAELGVEVVFSKDIKASVVARKMTSRLITYPMMMLRIRFAPH